MSDTAALQAQLAKLQEQLERKKLEEQIAALQAQLEATQAGDGGGNAGGAGGGGHEEEYYDEDEYEEVIEEVVVEGDYEPGEDDEEVIVEYVEEEVISSPEASPKKGRVPRGGDNSSPKKWGSKAALPAPAPAPAPVAPMPKPRLNNKLKMNNPFTKAMEDKKAAAAKKEEEKAARAAAVAPKPLLGDGGNGEEEDTGPLPPLPEYTKRTISKTPASSAGNETPMELLLGPKLYKQGRLIGTSTVAGCEGMDLIMLYFGTGWKRECKQFVELLLDFYTITTTTHIPSNADLPKLECVYISSDRNLQEFKTYFANMPWLAIPTGTSSYKNTIAKALYITDTPFVVVFDPNTGHVVTTNGVADIIAASKPRRRQIEQHQALLRKWKQTQPVPISEAEKEAALRVGGLVHGLLYWHE